MGSTLTEPMSTPLRTGGSVVSGLAVGSCVDSTALAEELEEPLLLSSLESLEQAAKATTSITIAAAARWCDALEGS